MHVLGIRPGSTLARYRLPSPNHASCELLTAGRDVALGARGGDATGASGVWVLLHRVGELVRLLLREVDLMVRTKPNLTGMPVLAQLLTRVS